MERSVLVFTTLKLAAAYLVHLGVRAWPQRGSLHAAVTERAFTRSGSGLRTLWEGFAVGVANPKTMVFFAAVLPTSWTAPRAT